MAGINRVKIGLRIYKQLERKGLLKEIKILRIDQDTYGEKSGALYITTIKGYYHKEKSKINISTESGATININYYDKLLVVYNEESKKIKQDDYFILQGTKYKVIDTGKVEDIVFDMHLDRM